MQRVDAEIRVWPDKNTIGLIGLGVVFFAVGVVLRRRKSIWLWLPLVFLGGVSGVFGEEIHGEIPVQVRIAPPPSILPAAGKTGTAAAVEDRAGWPEAADKAGPGEVWGRKDSSVRLEPADSSGLLRRPELGRLLVAAGAAGAGITGVDWLYRRVR